MVNRIGFKILAPNSQPIIRELNELKTERIDDHHLDAESEADKIEEIIEEVKEQKASTDKFVSEDIGLREKFIEFDKEIIKKSFPDTPDNKRLLRSDMLDAFLEYLPMSKSEFLEYMPPYLRESTEANEAQRFLEDILEIINASAEREHE